MRYIFFILAIAMVSCEPLGGSELGTQMGYAPIYASAQTAKIISVEPVRPTGNPGKIYAWNQYLFQVEQGEGIHIINNTDPQNAEKIAFLKIPLCSELAIKSNHLYSNNYKDLVVFNLANINSPQLVNRIENAFPDLDQAYPPVVNTYFECADPSKGIVVGWEQKMLTNPKCRR